MQLQKFMFQFAQKSNKQSKSSLCWSTIAIVALIMAIWGSVLFVYGETVVRNDRILETCLQESKFGNFEYDSLVYIYTDDQKKINNIVSKLQQPKPIQPLQPIQPTQQSPEQQLKQFQIWKSPSCTIVKNLNHSLATQQPRALFTGLYMLYKMQQKNLPTLHFNNYTLILTNLHWTRKYLYAISDLIGAELVQLCDQDRLSKVVTGYTVYFRSYSTRFYYAVNIMQQQTILDKLKGIIIIIIAYATVSIATSLYVYITIMCSPAMIMLFMKLTPYGRTEMFFQLLKSFPWVGMHSLILRGASHRVVREGFMGICFSLILYFFFVYLGYYTAVVEVTTMFFDLPVNGLVGEFLFGYLTIVEFASLVYMRTRPFIQYFPRINTLLMLALMLYCRFSHFGFKLEACISVICFSACMFAFMMVKLEIPAMTQWDPRREYVPNIKQPRAGLMPSFNLNWINGMPQEWTILVPLVGREFFQKKELAFVDQEYEELNQYLNQ